MQAEQQRQNSKVREEGPRPAVHQSQREPPPNLQQAPKCPMSCHSETGGTTGTTLSFEEAERGPKVTAAFAASTAVRRRPTEYRQRSREGEAR